MPVAVAQRCDDGRHVQSLEMNSAVQTLEQPASLCQTVHAGLTAYQAPTLKPGVVNSRLQAGSRWEGYLNP